MTYRCHHYSATTLSRLFKGLSTPGNKVAENGNKLLPEPKQQQLLPETATLSQHLSKSPFMPTICCRFRQQQFVAVFGNNLLPGVDRP